MDFLVVLAAVLLVACNDLRRTAAAAPADPQPPGTGSVPPEVVSAEEIEVEHGVVKVVTVANSRGRYVLSCSLEAPAPNGCITPEPNKRYLLLNSNTRWKLPGATEEMTLAFIQDWTLMYNTGENVGLVSYPGEKGATGLGVFLLRSWTAR